ncbi:MAG: hypothetical protein ABR500_13995 [Dermatophilaceae bacterium]|nr:hypothetical protein [Intrasporangiaceae bacterium]
MTETLQRSAVVSRERHHLAADAFLYAGVVILAGTGVQLLIAYLKSGAAMEPWTSPVGLELVVALTTRVIVLGAPLLAWLVYGRTVGWRDLIAAVVGGVVGGALAQVAFSVTFALTRILPSPFPRDGVPWEFVIIATLAIIAFLARPVIAAVRDLAGTKEHPRRDVLRLGVVAVIVAVAIVSMFLGGVTAPFGLSLAVPAAGAACAAIAMDWWRVQQHRAAAHPTTA